MPSRQEKKRRRTLPSTQTGMLVVSVELFSLNAPKSRASISLFRCSNRSLVNFFSKLILKKEGRRERERV